MRCSSTLVCAQFFLFACSNAAGDGESGPDDPASSTDATGESSGHADASSGGTSAATAASTAGTTAATATTSDTSEGSTSSWGEASSGSDGSTGAPDDAPVHIVVLGASTAAGKNLVEGGYSLEDSWVNRYAAFLDETRPGSTVTNLAVAGYLSYHALPDGTVNPPQFPAVDPAHNVTMALSSSPDAIIVNFPDGGALDDGATIEALVANYSLIADTAGAEGVEVWIATSQPNLVIDANQFAERAALRDAVFEAFGEFAIDFWSPFIDDQGNVVHINPYDDVHPDDVGHLLLFQQVQAAGIPEEVLP
ncbi:MAG: SGNH/GDSL hydrolase family protein [Nannocystaceae bacterium]|nr:SGNH/GDSL hydrolase family protein [Nannocystaceae bacterium]